MEYRQEVVGLAPDEFFFGSIDSKLHQGELLHYAYRNRFESEPQLSRGFAELLEYQRHLAGLMEEMALGSLCCRCAVGSGGGCCSLEMAGEIDAVQIFLNLLAGVAVVRGDNGGECCFLGPGGCIFLFKPMFCLNYNCHHIHSHCSPRQMTRLLSAAGRLLGRQYEIEALFLTLIASPDS